MYTETLQRMCIQKPYHIYVYRKLTKNAIIYHMLLHGQCSYVATGEEIATFYQKLFCCRVVHVLHSYLPSTYVPV